MSWFKADDQLPNHKKTRRAGVEAMGLWLLCGAWSAAQEEDGFVPDYIAETFTPKARQYADRLVKAGFWQKSRKDNDDGWQFHDWNDYQPTAEAQQAKRAAWAERQRKSRSQRTLSRVTDEGLTEESPESHDESHGAVTESRPDPTRRHLRVTPQPPTGGRRRTQPAEDDPWTNALTEPPHDPDGEPW